MPALQIDDFVFSTLLLWMREDGEFLVDKHASPGAPASAGAGGIGKATALASLAAAKLPEETEVTFLPDVSGSAAAAGDTSYAALQSAEAADGGATAAPATKTMPKAS